MVESPEWQKAVIAGQPNSVAALLYQDFKPAIAGSTLYTVNDYFGGTSTTPADLSGRLCDLSNPAPYSSIGNKLLPIFGVTAAEITSDEQTTVGSALRSTLR